MDENINSTYSFWQLISEYRIEIPIIQRDYAQGRPFDNETSIREELIDSIYKALTENKYLDFDFVYGTIENDKLLPLDGQQRLTTFFLLHWYIAVKERRLDEVAEALSKFSYSTRISSREFCEMLVNTDYVLTADMHLSEKLRDENRYFKAWDTDPTIDSMLRMLNKIHEVFFNTDDLLDKLIGDNPLLTFSFKPMEHYNLTDDLYIKMNARGKPLTNFENFKAKFIQHLRESNLDYRHFEESIDCAWTDLLWDYRGKNNTIDNAFMNLFCYLTEMISLFYAE